MALTIDFVENLVELYRKSDSMTRLFFILYFGEWARHPQIFQELSE